MSRDMGKTFLYKCSPFMPEKAEHGGRVLNVKPEGIRIVCNMGVDGKCDCIAAAEVRAIQLKFSGAGMLRVKSKEEGNNQQ